MLFHVLLTFSRKTLYIRMFERHDIEDEAFVVERHDDDAINTQDSVILQRPHEDYKIREAFQLSGTGYEDSCLMEYGAL